MTIAVELVIIALLTPIIICVLYFSSCFCFTTIASYERHTGLGMRLFCVAFLAGFIGFLCASFGLFG